MLARAYISPEAVPGKPAVEEADSRSLRPIRNRSAFAVYLWPCTCKPLLHALPFSSGVKILPRREVDAIKAVLDSKTVVSSIRRVPLMETLSFTVWAESPIMRGGPRAVGKYVP